MAAGVLTTEALIQTDRLSHADIVIGIPSFNNGRTIGHVVQAAHTGLMKYFPQFTGVIVNSDGGSTDNTRDQVLQSRIEDSHLLLLNTPLKGVHRLSLPYHGIPGKGSAFRLIFAMAERLGAKACAVVDSDLRSITPEWIDLLIRPVLLGGQDFVAPYYRRHKYDGTITNSIIYPLTRALYGRRIRQPIGGDFGLSPRMVQRFLSRTDWESDVARFGIDIWMTTIAVAEQYAVCQSYLGAKLHDAKDPGADLSSMFQQVLGSVFGLMEEYHDRWNEVNGSSLVDLYGFRFDVGLEPIPVNLARMLHLFRSGVEELGSILGDVLTPETRGAVDRLARESSAENAPTHFHLPDPLWIRIVFEYAAAWHRRSLQRGLLLKAFTPLYFARVASWVIEAEDLTADTVEDRMEQLCLRFEQQKDELRLLWAGHPPLPPEVGISDSVVVAKE